MTTRTAILLSLLLAAAMPLPKRGTCPSGYFQSGAYCTPMTDKAPRAISKVGSCPSGWAQSGSYCIENRRNTR
jgi:hypothetical protein